MEHGFSAQIGVATAAASKLLSALIAQLLSQLHKLWSLQLRGRNQLLWLGALSQAEHSSASLSAALSSCDHP